MAQISDERFNAMMIEHITTANAHIPESEPGVAGAAFMQAAARFNAFVSAYGFPNGEMMRASKDKHIDHYVKLYRDYLEGHFADYIENFDHYQRPKAG